MSIAELITALEEAGAPLAAIKIAVRAVEEASLSVKAMAAEDRKRGNRSARNRRYYEKHRLNQPPENAPIPLNSALKASENQPPPPPRPSCAPAFFIGEEEVYVETNVSTPIVPIPINRSADFHRFWESYPHKVGKPTALRAFVSATKKPTYSLQAILDGLKQYIANKPADRSWLNPATFLNQERWNDRPGAVKTNGRANDHKPSTLDIFHRIGNGTYKPRNSGGLFDDEGADADVTIIDGVAFEVCRSN